MKTRIISGFFITIVTILIAYLGGNVLLFSLMALSLIGLHEFYKALNGKHENINYIAYVFTLVFFLFVYFANFSFVFPMGLFIAFAIALFCYLVLTYPKVNINNVAITFMGVMYIPVSFIFVYYLRETTYGVYTVWLPFITAFTTDTFAYFTGVFFGKHKLIPHLSPNKTIEGSIGGIVGCIISCVLFSLYVSSQIGKDPVQIAIFAGIIGLVCSIFAQFGDLTASSIKRLTGVKDFGNLIPGHGGVLDRFDSILFTAPIIAIILNFLISI